MDIASSLQPDPDPNPGTPAAGPRAVGPDRVEVWWCRPDDLGSPEAVRACEGLLTPDELADQRKFRFARHRHEYLVTRAMARCVLSLYSDVAPTTWRFARTEHGKPVVAAPEKASFLRFSLSNTSGLVACGVTAGQEVGVDVEDTTRSVELLELAERFFSPLEARELRELEPSRRRGRFFEYWTLKEAYIKARGLGLSLPLEAFSFQFGKPDGENPEHPGEIRIGFHEGIEDDPEAWQFRLFQLLDRFTLSVGIHRGRRADVAVRVAHFVPAR